MAYRIVVRELAVSELRGMRAFDRRRIIEEIEKQLSNEPTVTTRNRKRLDALSPNFEHVPPIWELRVGDHRVFYDVDHAAQMVFVRAVRRKESHQATEDLVQ